METAFIVSLAAPTLTKTPSALVCQTAIFFFDCNEPSVIWGLAETNLFATSFQPVSHLTRNNVPDVHLQSQEHDTPTNLEIRVPGPRAAALLKRNATPGRLVDAWQAGRDVDMTRSDSPEKRCRSALAAWASRAVRDCHLAPVLMDPQ